MPRRNRFFQKFGLSADGAGCGAESNAKTPSCKGAKFVNAIEPKLEDIELWKRLAA
jgi:hypothetical protein